MNKEINYSGHTAQPSDYLSEDGELALSINLIPNEGAMQPTFAPKKVHRLAPSTLPEGSDFEFTGRVVFLHRPNSNSENYFIIEQEGGPFKISYWMSKSSKFEERKTLYIFKDGETFVECKAVGNVVSILTSDGIYYATYTAKDSDKEYSYSFLGSLPELPKIELGLDVHFTRGDLIKDFEYPPGCGYPGPNIPATQAEMIARRKTNIDKLLASANKLTNTFKSEFLFPFFIRYAYRLYDGRLVKHSAPILMIPASDNNPLFKSGEHTEPFGTKDLETCFFHSKIRYRIIGLPPDIKKWENIIDSVEFYVSKQLYTYNQDPDVSLPSGVISIKKIDGKGWAYDDTTELRKRRDERGFSIGAAQEGGRWFFKKRFVEDYIIKEYNLKPTTAIDIVTVPVSQDLRLNEIKNCSTFYKYKTIPLSEIISHKVCSGQEIFDDNTFFEDYGTYLTADDPGFDNRNIYSYPVMEADPFSHLKVSAKTSFEYNNRLHVANLKKELFDGFSLTDALTHTTLQEGNDCKIYVHLRKNGYENVVCCDNPYSPKELFKIVSDSYGSIFKSAITYFFYPDPDVYRIDLVFDKTNKVYSLPMKRHETIYGSYFFTDYRENVVKEIPYESYKKPSVDKIYYSPNQCYVSEVNNPFVFDPKYQFTVGFGEIIGLSSAAKAMSQGQFGQFPLYIFTTEGVWAASVTSEGKYSTTSPFTRDVCVNSKSIAQLDSEVAFATARGIMILSGSTSTCITEVIDGQSSANIRSLKNVMRLSSDSISYRDANILPFSDFLVDSKMIYDYVHQRMILFNPSFSYAYQFSLLSKKWGMMQSALSYTVNSYPDALAVEDSRFIVNLSEFNRGASSDVMMITRPFKLGGIDVFKTISSIINRGYFPKGNIRYTALYGSRDMNNWIPIWASKGDRIEGIMGTPYKFFTLTVSATLSEGDSICGASVLFSYRETNRMK